MKEKRKRIREIDKQICDLLIERGEVAKELAEIKRDRGLNITDSDQEKVVIKRAEEWTFDRADESFRYVPEIFRKIIEFTKVQMWK